MEKPFHRQKLRPLDWIKKRAAIAQAKRRRLRSKQGGMSDMTTTPFPLLFLLFSLEVAVSSLFCCAQDCTANNLLCCGQETTLWPSHPSAEAGLTSRGLSS
jgi:hypothetical protein